MAKPKGPLWWGEFSLAEGERGKWRIGALDLWAERRPLEWRIHHQTRDDPFDAAVAVEVPAGGMPTDGIALARFSMGKPGKVLNLQPVLPDRPLVSSPDSPFFVLPGEQVLLFISSPVWVRVSAKDRQLLELPIYRSSDTWFGPSTREGELCYASRTRCRTELEDLPPRPHRAVTSVHLQNRTEGSILVERLNLPVRYLSLFSAADGKLWTETLTLVTANEGETAEIQIGKGPPDHAKGARLQTGPRESPDKNLLVRALGALIG